MRARTKVRQSRGKRAFISLSRTGPQFGGVPDVVAVAEGAEVDFEKAGVPPLPDGPAEGDLGGGFVGVPNFVFAGAPAEVAFR